MGGIFPLPLKIKTNSGYELLDDRQLSFEEKPREVIDASKYEYDRTASKDKAWQRRLLDLSLKNNLLNFRYTRDCIHVLSSDLVSFCEKIESRDKFNLLPNTTPIKNATFFGGAGTKNMGELISIELKAGKMRCYSSADALAEICGTLMRKSRAAEEEAGAKTLYLAFGFLK
ncbi:MAG: DUF4011 domain-containing protein, partial [Clostridia bacterium]|nr:DUF4011 domain-containing protein [Clostridia bacterium]